MIKPFFQNPDRILVNEVGPDPSLGDGVQTAMNAGAKDELKSPFRRSDKVDYERLWHEIIRVAEANGVRIAEQVLNHSEGFASNTPAEIPSRTNKGYIFEKLTFEMTDEHKDEPQRSGESFVVRITSKTWLRTSASEGNVLQEHCTGFTAFAYGFECSDEPLLRKIMTAVLSTNRR
jgi:hypothetical protein